MRKQIWNILLNEVTKYGVTVLVGSHNLRELEDVYARIMNRGILERSLELQEVYQKDTNESWILKICKCSKSFSYG